MVCDVLPFHMSCCMASMYVGSDCVCACVGFGSKIMINLTSFFLHGNMLWHNRNQWSEWVV